MYVLHILSNLKSSILCLYDNYINTANARGTYSSLLTDFQFDSIQFKLSYYQLSAYVQTT